MSGQHCAFLAYDSRFAFYSVYLCFVHKKCIIRIGFMAFWFGRNEHDRCILEAPQAYSHLTCTDKWFEYFVQILAFNPPPPFCPPFLRNLSLNTCPLPLSPVSSIRQNIFYKYRFFNSACCIKPAKSNK